MGEHTQTTCGDCGQDWVMCECPSVDESDMDFSEYDPDDEDE
jgi:hypothetical protein